MKDLKAFMAKVSEDQGLAKKVMAAQSNEEVVSIAAAAGYKFTEDDLMDEQMSQVAGGRRRSFSFSSFMNGLNTVTQGINDGADAVSQAAKATAGAVDAVADGVDKVAGAGRNAFNNVRRQF